MLTKCKCSDLLKTSYNFIKEHCKPLEVLVEPLKEFGITYFSFSRVYKNGEIIFFCSDEEWLQVKFDYGLFEYDGFFPCEDEIINNYNKHIYTGDVSIVQNNKLFEFFYENDKWNSIDLYFRQNEYVDVAHFSSSRSNVGVINFYLNRVEQLYSFFNNFRVQFDNEIKKFFIGKYALNLELFHKKNINNIINDSLFEMIDDGNHFYGDCLSRIDDGLKKILFLLNDKPICINGTNVTLTSREIECYYLLARGKSYKEIAQYLNISPRTVESYINHIKIKTGIQYKTSLIETFYSFYGEYI
jgi:DNA-binding CsgD family transcriptional regulator